MAYHKHIQGELNQQNEQLSHNRISRVIIEGGGSLPVLFSQLLVSLAIVPSAARVNFTKLPRPSAHWHADEEPTTGKQLPIGVPWNAA